MTIDILNKSLMSMAFLSMFFSKASAQLTFPQGNVMNLNTTNDFLYEETRLFFNTGIYKANDYNWEKISDSIDSRWFVTSCFNGECRNEIEQSGNFLNDYGINDTTCFIAFHVETYELNGTSVIKYKVYNRKNISDSAHLTFNILYSKPLGVDRVGGNEFVIYPNPASVSIHLRSIIDLGEYEIQITNILGETVLRNPPNETIDVSLLPKGIYSLKINQRNNAIIKKFIKI